MMFKSLLSPRQILLAGVLVCTSLSVSANGPKSLPTPSNPTADNTQSSSETHTKAQSGSGSSWYSDFKVVPFGFISSSIGNSIGAAGVLKGAGQPQAALIGAGFVSDKGSYMTYLGGYNYQIANNWLLNMDGYSARFKDYDYYLGANSHNNSNYDDSVESDGQESRLQASFRYILPIGLGAELGGAAGFAPTRDVTSANPLKSGVSTLWIRPFYKTRDLDDYEDYESNSTWGVEIKADWDNRDDIRNTTTGSRTQLGLTYAPDLGNDNPWTTWEFQNSQFWDLGSLGKLFNKQVLAFDFYTAGTPSWDNGSAGNEHRPPEYAGVRLGGIFRQRAFSGGRFTGRAAINYSLEYRVMPDWQPLQNWPIFDLYNVPWWQWVVFTDIGRVADDYDISTLHKDMQTSVGGAIRFQVEGVVVRTEMAWGDEESIFRVMINQPF
ncbi:MULTISPECIES: BamA/TamA family outer membrane protein [Vibrio]|uniref:Bacterial surface antigen (D15) domain-containing protein n=1 Tax=Vibrio algicola TaxID=2662262 RepID=A0A5Q0TFQ9_9VIBR|nr:MULTISPECIES: hypothetical protein [Vibrio]MBD1576315.1 hypothetical protein [Vibrio sp. S11_S32]